MSELGDRLAAAAPGVLAAALDACCTPAARAGLRAEPVPGRNGAAIRYALTEADRGASLPAAFTAFLNLERT